MVKDCFICQKHKGGIPTAGSVIYEDDEVYIGHIDKRQPEHYLGHIMIDVKRHVAALADMSRREAEAFGVAMARVSQALMQCEQAEHVYALVSGNSVSHVHMHLVARYPGTPTAYWGPMEVYDAPNARIGTSAEVEALCKRIRNFMEETVYE